MIPISQIPELKLKWETVTEPKLNPGCWAPGTLISRKLWWRFLPFTQGIVLTVVAATNGKPVVEGLLLHKAVQL